MSVEPFIQDGVVMVPKRAEGPDGLVGVGYVPLTADDPQYRQWLDYLAAKGITPPRRPAGGR